MKIFISWSGERSLKIAELFDDWIQCVIQAAKPWISSHDIERGAMWFSEISKTGITYPLIKYEKLIGEKIIWTE